MEGQKQRGVRMTDGLWEDVGYAATEAGVSASTWVRMAVMKALEADGVTPASDNEPEPEYAPWALETERTGQVNAEAKRLLEDDEAACRAITGAVQERFPEGFEWEGRSFNASIQRMTSDVNASMRQAIFRWLSRCRIPSSIDTMTFHNRPAAGAYGWKHVVEKDEDEYIYCELFVAAALACGVEVGKNRENVDLKGRRNAYFQPPMVLWAPMPPAPDWWTETYQGHLELAQWVVDRHAGKDWTPDRPHMTPWQYLVKDTDEILSAFRSGRAPGGGCPYAYFRDHLHIECPQIADLFMEQAFAWMAGPGESWKHQVDFRLSLCRHMSSAGWSVVCMMAADDLDGWRLKAYGVVEDRVYRQMAHKATDALVLGQLRHALELASYAGEDVSCVLDNRSAYDVRALETWRDLVWCAAQFQTDPLPEG